MFNFFKTKALLADDDAQWILSTFHWALMAFDSEEFFQRSRLIEPNDKFFPGVVDSHQAMASTVFSATLKYTGLSHWPIQLLHPVDFTHQAPVLLNIDFSAPIKRDSSTQNIIPLRSNLPLNITYHVSQTFKPEDLSASFSHYIAQHLVAQSKLIPIGGKHYFAQATEIVSVFMGFGIVMANSAYTFRGSCGRCYNKNANRHASLSEDKIIFALAIFCRLKKINKDQVAKHLKKYLRGYFKQAVKQVDGYSAQLQALREINK